VKGVFRWAGFLILSLVVGEVVKRALTSRPGRSVLGRIGRPEFGTLEGADEASKKVKQGIEFARSLSRGEPKQVVPRLAHPTGPRWVRVVRDASEMMLATGALLKAISDFVREDEQLRRRFRRLGARVE